jgi:hypothetical protein
MCLRVGGGINLPPSKRRFTTSRQLAQKCEESGLPLRAHCKGFSHENGRITLRGVNPLTISFSDRPTASPGTCTLASSSRCGARLRRASCQTRQTLSSVLRRRLCLQHGRRAAEPATCRRRPFLRSASLGRHTPGAVRPLLALH